jgi:uroporphyrinogen-III synthase
VAVVLTRAVADAQASATLLAARGFETVLLPVTRIVVADPPAIPPVDFVVATSRHAFACLAALPAPDRAALLARPLYAVGAATAAQARAAGFRDLRAASGDAAALVDLLALTGARGRALYLAGADRKPGVEAALDRMGVATTLVVAYEAAPLVWDADARAAAAAAALARAHVLHYSRRAATLFVARMREADLEGGLNAMRHLALSQDAGAPLSSLGLDVRWPARPREDDLFALLRG